MMKMKEIFFDMMKMKDIFLRKGTPSINIPMGMGLGSPLACASMTTSNVISVS